MGGTLERRRVGVRACGGNIIALIQVTILTIKNYINKLFGGLRWPIDDGTHNNQPKKSRINAGWY